GPMNRFSLLASRLPLQKLSRSRLPGELTVLDDDFSAREDRLHFARDLSALVWVVVDPHVERLGRKSVLLLRVEDHQIGVGTGSDRSLFREEAEDLRGRGRGQLDEPVETDPALADTAVIDEMETRLDARRSIGDLREVVFPELFLLLHAE